MDNGTAAVFVVLEDCDPDAAFDVDALAQSQARQGRKALDVNTLFQRIDWVHMEEVMAVHTACFLVQAIPSLSSMQAELNTRLRVNLRKHRMRKGRRTEAYPLATSGHDEGKTEGNAKVLDDLMLRQLGLDKKDIDKIITIVCGDQSTIEKLRTLKRFLNRCPHGYARYGWVLPLIQLWHMGWADLERILSTHWGSSASDASTFQFVNELLGRKVKNIKRPDYYPAQSLVFDTLK